jgi:hypothetical protein
MGWTGVILAGSVEGLRLGLAGLNQSGWVVFLLAGSEGAAETLNRIHT